MAPVRVSAGAGRCQTDRVDFLLLELIAVGAFGLKVWALVDAVSRPGPAYVAAGKLTKPAWLAILAVAVLLSGANVLGFFGIVGAIAAVVYLVDVRPAVKELRGGSSGPYGGGRYG